MTHPSGTGYQRNLYAVRGVLASETNSLEDIFFKRIDQDARDALTVLETTGGEGISMPIRSAWSRFIRSLQLRTPENVVWLKNENRDELAARREEAERTWRIFREAGDPTTYAEARKQLDDDNTGRERWPILLLRFIDSYEVEAFINRMRCVVVEVRYTRQTFLTSDRPVVPFFVEHCEAVADLC